MDEIFDRIKNIKITRKDLFLPLVLTEILGILVLIWFLRVPLSQKFLASAPKAYSVVSLNPQKRYLISQNDFLTGKAIPDTQIKIQISPGNFRSTAYSDSTGNWSWQIPLHLSTGVYRISYLNIDKSQKEVTTQSYKFKVRFNIPLFNLLSSFWLKAGNFFSLRPSYAQAISSNLYGIGALPYPNKPISLTESERSRLINYFLPYAYSAAKIVGSDWRLMAMWAKKEVELVNFFDNCLDGNKDFGRDADLSQNTPCTGWVKDGAPNWQVGWGVYPYQWIDFISEAIAVMRPGESIQQIGQRVIDESSDINRYAQSGNARFQPPNDPITNPEFFPDNISLNEIIEGAKPVGEGDRSRTCRVEINKNSDPSQDPKDCNMRQLLGILMKDPAISAYFLALNWKGVTQSNVNSEIDRQGGYNLQEVSNILSGIEEAAGGIDLESLIQTPQITIPVAQGQDNGYVYIWPVVYKEGSWIDVLYDQKVLVAVIPHGTDPRNYDFPPDENWVETSSGSPNQINILAGGLNCVPDCNVYLGSAEVAYYPQDYDLCAILKPVFYPVVVSTSCIQLSEIVDPNTPLDTAYQIPENEQF
ncbi:hypothetical protein HYW44_01095 [Candidatus Daviesbacteria bacterium]|nr:hypothetical protein [Candidatus Daviesbacteria bacterium]